VEKRYSVTGKAGKERGVPYLKVKKNRALEKEKIKT